MGSLPRSFNGFINCLLQLYYWWTLLTLLPWPRPGWTIISVTQCYSLMATIFFVETDLTGEFNSCLPYNRRYDLEIESVEILVCEIHTNGSSFLIFSVFYRPPNAGMRLSWMGSGPFCINSMALEYLIKLSLVTLIFLKLIGWSTARQTYIQKLNFFGTF